MHIVTVAAAPVKTLPATVRAVAVANDAQRLVDALPDTVSPVAALGRAVKAPSVSPSGTRWVHAGQADLCSRWIYCGLSDVSRDHARIEGVDGAEVRAGGTLVIDQGVPFGIADALRRQYDAERGLIEPAKINAIVGKLMRDAGGVALHPGVYTMPDVSDDVRAVLATVVALGGFGVAFPLADEQIASVRTATARAIEDEVQAVVDRVADLAARAKACAAGVDGAADVRAKSGETAHRDLDDARARLLTLRDRLGLQVAHVEAAISTAGQALDAEMDAALAALEARRAARAARANAAA